jgi:hypothetical protein
MAKKQGSQKRKKATAQPPEIHLRGNTIVVSSTIPWTFQKDTHFGVNDSLLLTFKMEFDRKKLAKFIESRDRRQKENRFRLGRRR